MKATLRRELGLWATWLLVLLPSSADAATVLFFDDGAGNQVLGAGTAIGASQTFGDVTVGMAWKDDAVLQSTPEFVPPHTTNSNQSYVFHTNDVLAQVGGGVAWRIALDADPLVAPPPAKGLLVVTYGSAAKRKKAPGPLWQSNFHWRDTGKFDPDNLNFDNKWIKLVKQDRAGEIELKVLSYQGDPIVAPPPADEAPGDLGFDANELLLFFEVTDGPLDFIDLMIGDFLLDIEYEELNHHVSMIQVIGGVDHSSFGLDPTDAPLISLTRLGNLAPDGRLGIEAAFDMSDPLPEPATALLLFAGTAALALRRRSAH